MGRDERAGLETEEERGGVFVEIIWIIIELFLFRSNNMSGS